MLNIENYKNTLSDYTFIDLFAGIGGFHYALNSFGAKCIFASEIDEKASETYFLNHNIKPKGDITKILEEDIPKHDILCGGFPCQAFSISGKQKGFEDARGTLFFDIVRILNYHKPKILILENVKNFVKHDNNNTLKTALRLLKELNYEVYYKVLNTNNFGLPQNRERVYIIGFNKSYFKNIKFTFPNIKIESSLEDILEKKPKNGKVIKREDIYYFNKKYNNESIFENVDLPNRPLQIGRINKGGQGERIYDSKGHAITLSAYGGGVGSKTGLYKIEDEIRKLSPRECARLQGFPEDFILPKSISEAQKQFGNSVSINTLQYIIKEIVETLKHG